MREIAKSMLGFSWAVSLFGVQQLAKLREASLAATELDEVSRVVQSHLSEPVAQQFRAVDEWQRRMVDAVFDAASLTSIDPTAVAASLDLGPVVEAMDPRRMMERGVDLWQRSVTSVQQGARPAPSNEAPAQ